IFFSKIFIFQKHDSKCSLKVSGGLGRSREVSGVHSRYLLIFVKIKFFFKNFYFSKTLFQIVSKGLGGSREVSGGLGGSFKVFANLCENKIFFQKFLFFKKITPSSLERFQVVSGGLGRSREVSGGLGGSFKVFANLCENKIFFQKFLFFKNMIPNAL